MKQQTSPTRSGSTIYRTPGRRPRIDLAKLEQRRLRAARMFERGARPAEVARQFGVSCQAACNWRDSWQQAGAKGLKTPGMGRPAKLTAAQLKKVERVPSKGLRRAVTTPMCGPCAG